jgi:hypothetical protein
MLLARKPGQPPKTPSKKLERALEYVSTNADVFDDSFADLAMHPELEYYVPRQFCGIPLEELVSDTKYEKVVQLAYLCGWVSPF